MADDPTIATLLQAGALTESDQDEEFALDKTFLKRVDKRAKRIVSDDWRNAFATEVTCGKTYLETFAAVADRAPELLGTYWVLDNVLVDRTFSTLLRLSVVIDQLRYPPEETAGTPAGFLAVRGDRLPAIVLLVRYGVAYLWRGECDPCDVMAEQLAAVAERHTEQFVYLSVYGPPWTQKLNEAFEIAGAPTTLFVANGRVDSRLVGAFDADLIASELQTTADTVR